MRFVWFPKIEGDEIMKRDIIASVKHKVPRYLGRQSSTVQYSTAAGVLEQMVLVKGLVGE